METKDENEAVARYITALTKATTDNEKFAALLMVSKVTKEETCTVAVKRQILDTVGGKFFSRLLKTKSVPEDCPAIVYKSVAMSILSALCKDPDVACSPTLTENVSSFNTILLTHPDETDVDGKQLVDDTYECLNSLCQTSEGQQSMKKASSVSTLCEAITSQSYGKEKALDVLLCLASQFGGSMWEGCENGFHSVVLHFSKQFLEDQSLRKFELCKTLVLLLTAVPNVEFEREPQWVKHIVGGLDSILRSKVGKSQREPALRLASMLVDCCGMFCMLPPETADNKLFLLTTHLCCVEVRMVLEDTELKQYQTAENAKLLSSCYSFLESVINYMTAGPTLSLDDRQVLQLHSAMVGAFSAVIHFLTKVSTDSSIQWNGIILATVRVLAAWLSEETSALKEEVYELIPFLIQISKLCIPPEQQIVPEQNCSTQKQKTSITEIENVQTKISELNTEELTNKSDDNDTSAAMETDNLAEKTDKEKQNDKTDTLEDNDVGEKKSSESASDGTKENCNLVSCDSETEAMVVDKEGCETNMELSTEDATVLNSKPASKQVTFSDEHGDGNKCSEISKKLDRSKTQDKITKIIDITTLESVSPDKEVLSEKEISDLHMKVDVFHYLLPALCHFTAEDEPRQLLLDSGALSLLDLYMWKMWEKFIAVPNSRETQSSLLILCNIFLNFSIVEPACITKYSEFSHILLLAVKGVYAMELNEDYIGIWSHLVTLGLMLLRQLYQKTAEFLEAESLVKFYASCIKYVNGAYKVKHRKKGHGTLELAEEYKAMWDQISQTWFLSMQALSACIPILSDVPATVLKSGWLPAALKTLLDVKASGVAEEVRSCYLLLFTTMARNDSSAKNVIKEKGGLEFARAYRSKELVDLLQS